MSKFKVGDRVRVVREEEDRCDRPFVSIQRTGTVCYVADYGPCIDLDEDVDGYSRAPRNPRGWAYEESELELIND